MAERGFDLGNGWDVLIEYSSGFFFGLLIFQAMMMVAMYAGNYLLAVRKTFFAETVSMNLVMTGMIPVMLFLAHLWPDSENPLQPAFWFRMSLATIAGGIIAFPINRWLVANHLKHGCMTLPGADGPAPGLGHRSPEAGGMAMGGTATTPHLPAIWGHGYHGAAQLSWRAGCRPRPRGHGHAGITARHSDGMDHRYLRGAARGDLGDCPVGTFALRLSLVPFFAKCS